MRVLTRFCALALTTGSIGCSYSMATGAPMEKPQAMIIVQNQSALEVEVYVWDGEDRATLLGSMTARDTVKFPVPETVTAAAGPYYLEARSPERPERPIHSDRFALRNNLRITWTIPPLKAAEYVPDEHSAPSDTAVESSLPAVPPGPSR
jgi:hypothetical protein